MKRKNGQQTIKMGEATIACKSRCTGQMVVCLRRSTRHQYRAAGCCLQAAEEMLPHAKACM